MQSKKKLPEKGKEKVKRAANYVRVSTVYQVDKDSLPMQRQELSAYCEYVLGITDYEFFEDAGYSGKNTDRPAYQKMMAKIREGQFTHLVVWKIDRISRNLLDFANMYDELKRLGVVFVSKNEQFDTSNAMGEAMLKIILVFAELERGMTSERVSATMINRASQGIWNGGKIYFGYSYNKESHEFSINPDENAIVMRIFDLYEETRSIIATARRLNEEGCRSRAGNEFSPVSVTIILRNPWYKGTYRYNYYSIPGRRSVRDSSEWVVVENHHTPTISVERFDRIQAMLDKNVRYRNSPGMKQGKHVHIFAGIIRCSVCGRTFTSSPGNLKASGYRPSNYSCPNMRSRGDCGARYTSDPIIGEFLLNYVLNIMNAQKHFSEIESPAMLQDRLLKGSTFDKISSIDADGLNALYSMLTKYSASDSVLLARPKRARVDPEIKRLNAELARQERALERLNHIYLYSDNEMSDREYIVRKQEITDMIQELRENIGMASGNALDQALSDEAFLAQASSFILNQKLNESEYIYFERLVSEVDPVTVKDFFNSILDAVFMRSGKIETVVFRNGLSHTFTYKEDARK